MSAHVHLPNFSTVSQYSIAMDIKQYDFNRQKLCRLGGKGGEKERSGKETTEQKTNKHEKGSEEGKSRTQSEKWKQSRG